MTKVILLDWSVIVSSFFLVKKKDSMKFSILLKCMCVLIYFIDYILYYKFLIVNDAIVGVISINLYPFCINKYSCMIVCVFRF